ncbi:hypothetical protein BDF19DRAFT_438332, partial [Syncephalis fuscata]
KKHNLLITDVLPMDNGVHYAKALDVKKEIYNTKSVLITCGNDSNKNYKNRVLSVYKVRYITIFCMICHCNYVLQAFAEKTIDPKHPNASGKKFIAMPSLNFKVENGQCYVTSTRCDTKLKDIPRLFSSKTTKPYSPLFGDIISDIANGMGYLRALGWLYNMDLNGK